MYFKQQLRFVLYIVNKYAVCIDLEQRTGHKKSFANIFCTLFMQWDLEKHDLTLTGAQLPNCRGELNATCTTTSFWKLPGTQKIYLARASNNFS